VIDKTAINAFATRFGATWSEYRITEVIMKIRMMSSINPGLVQFWFDEQSITAPTATEAVQRAALSMSASDIAPRSIVWRPTDINDLTYVPIGTTQTVCSYKTYTDNANFGSANTVVNYLVLAPLFRVQFRGIV